MHRRPTRPQPSAGGTPTRRQPSAGGTPTRRHARRRLSASALSALALAAAPLLSACGGTAHPGAAAVVGNTRITEAQLQHRVGELHDAVRELSSDAQTSERIISGSGSLARPTLQGMVRDRVVARAAADKGVTVSRAEVQSARAQLTQQAGGEQGLKVEWLTRYGVPPSRLDDALRENIAEQKLYAALGADPSSPDGKATVDKTLAATAKKLKVDVNPRYGTWDAAKATRADARPAWLRDVSRAPSGAAAGADAGAPEGTGAETGQG
ncbi:SurA N-terminal domain-containing protein [Streptomyces sp. NPDC058426]|uniref:SurA N-terminal domain-containing protein n=1 Tax=Streptomyces sp. NPDC058426 TaxID=3346493 RepID=UPI00364EC0CE